MNRPASIFVLMLAGMAVAGVACTSPKNDEETPQASGSVTATTESAPISDDGTPTSNGAQGTRSGPGQRPIDLPVIIEAGGPGQTSGIGFGQLPVQGPAYEMCSPADGAAVELLQDSVTVADVTLHLLYVARAAPGEDLWFIAAELQGPGINGDGPVAVWATLNEGGASASYENTWVANETAAEYSSLTGGGGLNAVYSQFPGFEDAQQCVQSALNEIGHVAAESTSTPGYVFDPSRCSTPPAAKYDLITGSMKSPEISARGIRMARPVEFGSGDVTWIIAADLEGGEFPSEGPFAFWISVVSRDGSSYTVSADPLAQQYSNLPGPSSAQPIPDDPEGFFQAKECSRQRLGLGSSQTVGPTPEPVRAVFDPDRCVTPDAEALQILAKSLTGGATGIRAVQLYSLPFEVPDFSGSVNFVTGFIAADIEGPGQEGDGPIGVWNYFHVDDAAAPLTVVMAANVVAGEFGALPLDAVMASQLSESEGFDEAVRCTELALENGPGPTVMAVPRVLDESRCVPGDAATVQLLADSLIVPGTSLRAVRMVRSTQFNSSSDPTIGDLWFIAADIEGPGLGGEGPIAVWVAGLDGSGQISRDNSASASTTADQYSGLEGSFGAATFLAAFDGYFEAQDCVRAALEDGDVETAERVFDTARCVPGGSHWTVYLESGLEDRWLYFRDVFYVWSEDATYRGSEVVFIAAELEGPGYMGDEQIYLFTAAADPGAGIVWITGADAAAQEIFDPGNFAPPRFAPTYGTRTDGYYEAQECTRLSLAGELEQPAPDGPIARPPFLRWPDSGWCSPGRADWYEYLEDALKTPGLRMEAVYGVNSGMKTEDGLTLWFEAVEIEGPGYEGPGDVAVLLFVAPSSGSLRWATGFNALASDLFDFGDDEPGPDVPPPPVSGLTFGYRESVQCVELATEA